MNSDIGILLKTNVSIVAPLKYDSSETWATGILRIKVERRIILSIAIDKKLYDQEIKNYETGISNT